MSIIANVRTHDICNFRILISNLLTYETFECILDEIKKASWHEANILLQLYLENEWVSCKPVGTTVLASFTTLN